MITRAETTTSKARILLILGNLYLLLMNNTISDRINEETKKASKETTKRAVMIESTLLFCLEQVPKATLISLSICQLGEEILKWLNVRGSVY